MAHVACGRLAVALQAAACWKTAADETLLRQGLSEGAVQLSLGSSPSIITIQTCLTYSSQASDLKHVDQAKTCLRARS